MLTPLVVVTGVRINGTARLVLQGHLHLMGSREGDHIALKQRAIIRNDHVELIAVLDMDRPAVKVVAVLHEHEIFGTFFGDGVDRQDDSLRPFLDGNAKLHALAGFELPANEKLAVF